MLPELQTFFKMDGTQFTQPRTSNKQLPPPFDEKRNFIHAPTKQSFLNVSILAQRIEWYSAQEPWSTRDWAIILFISTVKRNSPKASTPSSASLNYQHRWPASPPYRARFDSKSSLRASTWCKAMETRSLLSFSLFKYAKPVEKIFPRSQENFETFTFFCHLHLIPPY